MAQTLNAQLAARSRLFIFHGFAALTCAVGCSSGEGSWREPLSDEERVAIYREYLTSSLSHGILVGAVQSISTDCNPILGSVSVEEDACHDSVVGLTVATVTVERTLQTPIGEGEQLTLAIQQRGDQPLLQGESAIFVGTVNVEGELETTCGGAPAKAFVHTHYDSNDPQIATALDEVQAELASGQHSVVPELWSDNLLREVDPDVGSNCTNP